MFEFPFDKKKIDLKLNICSLYNVAVLLVVTIIYNESKFTISI